MKANIKSVISGKVKWLEVRDRNGKLKTRLEDVPNILLNSALSSGGNVAQNLGTSTTFTSTAESYEDLDGTWSQSGDTITRATGTGTFPASPSQVANELYWYDAGANTGHRCHVVTRVSDTQITVSGVAKTITGAKLRRFIVNGNGISSTTGSVQTSGTGTTIANTYNYTTGTRVHSIRYSFTSAASAYSLGSIIVGFGARIKLPAPIAIDVEDQITFVYELTETCAGRSQDYELGAESIGIPQKHSMTSIVGNGTNVDVTFSAATHFLAGDKLDLRGVVPKRYAISSASSTSTTFTINTTLAHGLNVGDSVVIEGASVGAYNGNHTVASVVDSDTFTITNAANPGAMGASGTVRLATPATYFDDLGLATIASMVSSSVARITSAITGPDVDPVAIGGDPGVSVRFWPRLTTSQFTISGNFSNNHAGFRTAANALALADPTTPSSSVNTNIVIGDSIGSLTSASASNDWLNTWRLEWNAGVGKNMTRLKQVQFGDQNASGHYCQITFNTPFNKLDSQRLRVEPSKQILRTLDLTGL